MRSPIVLVVKRSFQATPERVFDAWLDPAAAGQWLFATKAGEMQKVSIDARVDGEFLIVERRDGADAEHFGTYREIDRPHRLDFTFSAVRDAEPTLVTIQISPTAEGCDLTLTHEMDAKWAEYEERTRIGWSTILTNLSATLARQSGEILIVRRFAAPRELVWRAWTDPSQPVRWHAPSGCEIEFPAIDLRQGGRFRSVIRTPDGADCWCAGEYREVTPPERLVYTIGLTDEHGHSTDADGAGKNADWPVTTTVSVTLAEDGGGTLLTLHQTASEAVGRRTGAYPSWLSMLDRLELTLPFANP